MKIRKFEKRGLKKFEFVNDCGYTRNGFYHSTVLFENGVEIAKHRCNYLNRTWENYTYQTVMLCAVRDLLEKIEKRITENYKKENNIKRLTSKKKSELEKNIKKDKRYKEIIKLRTELRGKVW